MRYRKKPVEVEAVQWTPGEGDASPRQPGWEREFFAFIKADPEPEWRTVGTGAECAVYVTTLEGEMRCSPGDWLIRGVQGEVYPCKPDIFAATYEPVVAGSDTVE